VTDQPPSVSAEHKWGPPYDRRAILGRIRAVETGGTTGYERKLEAELQAAQEQIAELERYRDELLDQARSDYRKLNQQAEREKGLRASLNARMRLLVKCEEREKGLREDMAQIALFAQEVQRGTTGGDAHECGKHIERIALAAQRTEEAGG